MKLFISVASATIVGACLLSAPASASPARETVSVRVSRAGLDLTSEGGRTAFNRRLRSAITTACQSNSSGINAIVDSRQCRDEMIADASAKIALLQTHDHTQLASIGAAR